MCLSRGVPRISLVALIVFGLSIPNAALAAETDELFGYTTSDSILEVDSEWVDPAVMVGLNPSELVEAPEFDIATLHDSTVFAAGIDWVPVEGEPLAPLVEHHVRVLQVIETLDRDLARAGRKISRRRPKVRVLNNAIAHEHAEEARLAQEIFILRTAIAEFAVRAFIAEDELDTALALPDTELTESRVVSDEVRGDQFIQIYDREAELAERQMRRAGLEEDLRVLRSELRTLRAVRLGLLGDLRSMQDLSKQTAATYQRELHQRLDHFVEGSDIPLVALNAYVIAARIQEVENPSCQIKWWMLAGIGKIESIHGHFGKSTLDINGNTTDSITGPPLDGRILEGAEYVTNGITLPEPTDRTGVVEIEIPVPTDDAAGSNVVTASATPDSSEAPAPAPVIKRLALIKDSDGGKFDGDATYDRAVGPMQFIPQTWRRYEVDANLDDELDPQNIYDASLASARYLCTAAGTMTSREGQERAYFAYNHDLEYSENVAAAAARYRSTIELPADPAGSAPHLGIADPTPLALETRAAETSKDVGDPALPDW